MKRRQIAALALACMLTLTSFTTYAENGTNPENSELQSDRIISQEAEVETTAMAVEETLAYEVSESEMASESESERISSEGDEDTALETTSEGNEALESDEEPDSSDAEEQATEESMSETAVIDEAVNTSETVAVALEKTKEEIQENSEADTENASAVEMEDDLEKENESETETDSESEKETETESLTQESTELEIGIAVLSETPYYVIPSEYVDYWIYLENGQTAYADAREIGFCQDGYIGLFNGMDYDSGSEIWYESEDQDPEIQMDRFTFENVKTGLKFVAEKTGKTVFDLCCNCVDEDGNYNSHLHDMYIGVVISDSGRGERSPGIYDTLGNLIRAFDNIEDVSEEVSPDELILTKDNHGNFLDEFDPSISLANGGINLCYIKTGKIKGIREIYYCLWDDEFCYSFQGLPFTNSFTELSYNSDYTGFADVYEIDKKGLYIALSEEDGKEIVTKDVTLGILLVMKDGGYTWDTVRIYGNENVQSVNMISPRPDYSAWPYFEFDNKDMFTIKYPEGVTADDIEAVGCSLVSEYSIYYVDSIPYMPGLYVPGEYGEDTIDCYYSGKYGYARCYPIEDGVVIVPWEFWDAQLSFCIRCKDGRTYYDDLPICYEFLYDCEYKDFTIYLEKGQTAFVAAKELGFCEDGFIGSFSGRTYDDIDGNIGFRYVSEKTAPRITLDCLSFENVKNGLVFVAEKNGERDLDIKIGCVDKKGYYNYHDHNIDVKVIISDQGCGEYSPGIYDGSGNLIRAFEETIVSNDQNTKPESGTSESQSAVTPNTSSSKVDSPATGDTDVMRIRILMLLCVCGTILVYLSEKREKL